MSVHLDMEEVDLQKILQLFQNIRETQSERNLTFHIISVILIIIFEFDLRVQLQKQALPPPPNQGWLGVTETMLEYA